MRTVFRRNPDYFRPGLPWVDGVEWLVMESWQPNVQNYAPNSSFDYGNRAAALWLKR